VEDLCQDLLGRLQLHGPACHRPGQEWAARDGGPRTQGQGAKMNGGFLSAGCAAAVSREVAA